MIDRINAAIGKTAAWLTLAMVIVSFIIVVIRYVFDSGFIWLQESVTWMHAVVFMLGAAYTLQQDEHVRVDVFYREMTAKKKACVNLAGVLIFIFPLCAFLAYEATDYVAASWKIREMSRNSGGLPYPLIPMQKSLLFLMPLGVALQGISLAMQSVQTLRSH